MTVNLVGIFLFTIKCFQVAMAMDGGEVQIINFEESQTPESSHDGKYGDHPCTDALDCVFAPGSAVCVFEDDSSQGFCRTCLHIAMDGGCYASNFVNKTVETRCCDYCPVATQYMMDCITIEDVDYDVINPRSDCHEGKLRINVPYNMIHQVQVEKCEREFSCTDVIEFSAGSCTLDDLGTNFDFITDPDSTEVDMEIREFYREQYNTSTATMLIDIEACQLDSEKYDDKKATFTRRYYSPEVAFRLGYNDGDFKYGFDSFKLSTECGVNNKYSVSLEYGKVNYNDVYIEHVLPGTYRSMQFHVNAYTNDTYSEVIPQDELLAMDLWAGDYMYIGITYDEVHEIEMKDYNFVVTDCSLKAHDPSDIDQLVNQVDSMETPKIRTLPLFNEDKCDNRWADMKVDLKNGMFKLSHKLFVFYKQSDASQSLHCNIQLCEKAEMSLCRPIIQECGINESLMD